MKGVWPALVREREVDFYSCSEDDICPAGCCREAEEVNCLRGSILRCVILCIFDIFQLRGQNIDIPTDIPTDIPDASPD